MSQVIKDLAERAMRVWMRWIWRHCGFSPGPLVDREDMENTGGGVALEE